MRIMPSWTLLLVMLLFAKTALSKDMAHDTSMKVVRPGREFGSELKRESLGLGPSMDVTVVGDLAYAIGKGELRILEAGRPTNPVIGRLKGLGNTRQIVISGGYAFITAREDGLFIVDVREPASPKLVHHYDTAELATAIAVSGQVAAVGNRFAGIEFLDVSDPRRPRFLSTIRVGEVQSVVFKDSWLYAGTWSEKEIVVIDASDPSKPRKAAAIPLEGNGDGLDVNGDVLAAATGHHARKQGRPQPGDEAFGHGHGVEFFDVSVPDRPRRLSRLDFPPFYRIGMDMWGVTLSSGHAFVNDSHNGVFVFDVSDPTKPRGIGWAQLPAIGGDPGPVAGLALGNGRIFLAGAHDDLHVVESPVAIAATPPTGTLKPPPPPGVGAKTASGAYLFEGAARSVAAWDENHLLLAAGSAGLQVIKHDPDGLKHVASYPTNGFARDVTSRLDRVYVAESLGGLSVWRRLADGKLTRTGAYVPSGRSVTQVTLADEGRVAFLAVGPNALQVVRLEADDTFRLIAEEKMNGLFYRDPFTAVTTDGKRLLVQWHAVGLHEFIAEDGQVRRTGRSYQAPMDTECGAVPWGQKWLATSRSGIFLLEEGPDAAFRTTRVKRPDDLSLPGKPSFGGGMIFISDPFLGDVSALDMSKPGEPKLVGRMLTNGHPGRVLFHHGKAIVPAGREGLLSWDLRKQGDRTK